MVVSESCAWGSEMRRGVVPSTAICRVGDFQVEMASTMHRNKDKERWAGKTEKEGKKERKREKKGSVY